MLAEIIDLNNFTGPIIKKEDTVYFFSDEWRNRKEQCENLFNSKSQNISRKVYARKCVVKNISISQASDFFNLYHIQGRNRLILVAFGLFFKDELLGVMSLGRHNRQNTENDLIVLDRLCFVNGWQVVGGSSRLLTYCKYWAENNGYKKIISFSDNRISDGRVYEAMGFELEKAYKPDYFYIDCLGNRISKQSQKKDAVHCPVGLTEYEWAIQRGLRRAWDAGKKRWVIGLHNVSSLRSKLSEHCAMQHKNGVFKHSHIRGYFKSAKNNKEIYYSSSYELRAMFLLENDPQIASFDRGDVFTINGHSRNPDLKAIDVNNDNYIIEIKPFKRLQEINVINQINDTKTYCLINNYIFSLWTEENSGLHSEHSIIKWAKEYIANTYGQTEWLTKSRESSRIKTKKHYHEKIKVNKENFYCDFCKTEHSVLKRSYDANISRNGRYICEKEGGHIAGPKHKKINPYLADNKKQCFKCKLIIDLSDFFKDKTKSDGYSSICKTCKKTSKTNL